MNKKSINITKKLLRVILIFCISLLGPRTMMRINFFMRRITRKQIIPKSELSDIRSLLQNSNPRIEGLKILVGMVLFSVVPVFLIPKSKRQSKSIRDIYSLNPIRPLNIGEFKRSDLCPEVRIIVRDFPLENRAGSYLRLFRLCRLIVELGRTPVVLFLNNLEVTKFWWGITSIDIESGKERWRGSGIEIHNFFDYFDDSSKLADNSVYWIHDLSSAHGFFEYAADKFFPKFLILDLVDLEFRRMQQSGVGDDEIQKNISLLKFAIRKSNFIVSISKQEQNILSSMFQTEDSKLSVISNIYPDFTLQEISISPKDYDFLFVGNFLHLPNLEAAEFIVKKLAPTIPTIKIAMVGGSAPLNLMDESKGSNVKWLGPIDDLEGLYRSTYAVIAPLKTGAGIKGKVLEAIYYGVPVIGSDVAWEGIPQADQPMGWIARTEADYVLALAKIKKNDTALYGQEYLDLLNTLFGNTAAKFELQRVLGCAK